jgi:hypothetical protein
MSKCEWCKSEAELIKGQCFECHSMAVLFRIGYEGTFESYTSLMDSVELVHIKGYLGKSKELLHGTSSMNFQ